MSEAQTCAALETQSELLPLDLFILQDNTGSMKDLTSAGVSKWEVVTQAVQEFATDTASADIGAGLGFFGTTATGGTPDAKGTESCEAAHYAKPVLGIAPLGANKAQLVTAIAERDLGGYTPTAPALQGAIQYAHDWAAAHPGRKVVVMLATDGLPNVCGTVDKVASVAKSGLAVAPPISTYVVGVIGAKDRQSLSNLNQFAKAGGTGSAFVVDTDGDTQKQFVNAMNSIRQANRVSCEFNIPEAPSSSRINFTQVAVDLLTGPGTTTALHWVADMAHCDSKAGGWYYDQNATPRSIRLCKTTCSAAQANTQAQVDLRFGCLAATDDLKGSGGQTSKSTTPPSTGSTDAPICLLSGQSCENSTECCAGICANGVCGTVIQ